MVCISTKNSIPGTKISTCYVIAWYPLGYAEPKQGSHERNGRNITHIPLERSHF